MSHHFATLTIELNLLKIRHILRNTHFHMLQTSQEFKKIIVFPSRINTFNPKDPNSKGSDLFLYEIYKIKPLIRYQYCYSFL